MIMNETSMQQIKFIFVINQQKKTYQEMQVSNFTKYLFFLNGVSSLLGWNAVLTSLDYFNQVYEGYNVYGIIPIFVFLGYVMVGFSYNTLHKYIEYKSQINIGFIILNSCLVVMLLLSIIFKNNTKIGFNLTILITVVIGISNNMVQLSFMAIMNYLSGQVVSLYTIGTAAGGLLIVFLRMIILAIKGPDSNNISAILIYFIVAISINVFDQVLNIKFFASDIYSNNVLPYQHENQQNNTQKAVQMSITKQNNKMNQKLTDNSSIKNQKKMYYYKLLYKAIIDVNPNTIIIFLNQIQTFMLFPNLAILPLIQDSAWPIIILLLFFNLGDTLGKIFCNYRKLFNQQTIIYLLIARVYFFWSIPGIIHFSEDTIMSSYAYIYINQFFFAFSNGIILNGSFVLVFQKSSLQYKKYIGIASGLLLQLGILGGALLAFPLNKLF